MEHDKKEQPEPLSIRARPRPVTQLNRKLIVVAVMAVVGSTGWFLVQGMQPAPKPLTKEKETLITERKSDYPEFLTFGPKSYADLARKGGPPGSPNGVNVAVAAVAGPVQSPAQPPANPTTPAAAQISTGPAVPPAPQGRTPHEAKVPYSIPSTPAKQAGPVRTASSPAKPVTEKPKPEKPKPWLFAKVEGETRQPETERPIQVRESKGTALFPPAKWALPVDTRYVLYRSQVIPATLLHDVNSDLPGPIRLLVTQDVLDKHLSGVVLVPQYSYIHGQQEGSPKYGQSRLGMVVEGLEFPDGTYMAFGKAKAGDQSGAVGLKGKLDNHYKEVIIGAVLTSLLSVGSRAAAGSTSGFQASVPQEFAQDASKSINQSGKEIVKRSLEIAPTITLAYGTPVTVQLLENISFQQEPVLTEQ